MAVQKFRKSKSSTKIRRSRNDKRTLHDIFKCPKCDAFKLPHRVCLKCNSYKNETLVLKK